MTNDNISSENLGYWFGCDLARKSSVMIAKFFILECRAYLSENRNSLQRMQIGDRIVYYIMNLQRFGATATITGDYVEDHTKMWDERR